MQTTNNKMDLTKTNANVERVWAAASLVEHFDHPMDTTMSTEERKTYGIDANVIATIAECKVKGLIEDEVDRIYREPSQAKVQILLVETIFHMLYSGISTPLIGFQTAFCRLLQTILIDLFNHGATSYVISECLNQWSNLGTFMNAIVMRVISIPNLNPPVAVFVK